MSGHVEALERKIREAEAERATHERQLEERMAALRELLGQDAPDPKRTGRLEADRDALQRALNRTVARIAALEERLPAARKADAEARAREVQPRYDALREQVRESSGRLFKILGELDGVVSEIEAEARPLYELREELRACRALGVEVDVAGVALPVNESADGFSSQLRALNLTNRLGRAQRLLRA